MNLLSLIATFTIITLAVQAQTIDFSKYDRLTAAEKAEFFGGMSKMRLQNEADFIKALVAGAKDPNEEVRKRAVNRAATALAGLQELAQSGQPVPASASDLEELSPALRSLVTSADAETRAAAVRGVVALGPPAAVTEALLLRQYEEEPNGELRASLVEAMTSAGYRSDTFKEVVASRVDKVTEKEWEAICKACARLGLTEALPALIARIGQEDVPQVILIRSIAEFGKAAGAAREKLERLAADPSSVLQAEARNALAALATEGRPLSLPRPFVDLVAASSSSGGVGPAPPGGEHPETGTASAPPKTRQQRPSTLNEFASKASWPLLGVAGVLALGLLWLLAKRRK